MNIFTRSLLIITLLISSSALQGAAASGGAGSGMAVATSPTLKAEKLIEAITRSPVTIPLKTSSVILVGTVVGTVYGLDVWVSNYCDPTDECSFLRKLIDDRYPGWALARLMSPVQAQAIFNEVNGQLNNVLIELSAWFRSLTAENQLALRERYDAVCTQIEGYKTAAEATEGRA